MEQTLEKQTLEEQTLEEQTLEEQTLEEQTPLSCLTSFDRTSSTRTRSI